MKNNSTRIPDCFALFSSINNCVYQDTKTFLMERFGISFERIADTVQNDDSTANSVDKLYNAVYSNTYGYSLEMINETTYGEYTHSGNRLTSNYKLLYDFDTQIKFHCIISALYTICAILKADEYKSLVYLPYDYKDKIYTNPSSKNDLEFYGYNKADKELRDKFRYALETLVEPDRRLPPSADDGTAAKILARVSKPPVHPKPILYTATESGVILNRLCNFYLCNALNYFIDNPTYNINLFLPEFSFDLLVNQMRIGFPIMKKMETLSKQSPNNDFRRQVRSFVDGLSVINENFTTQDNSPILSLLYNWKKESLFHINMLNYLTSSECPPDLFKYAEKLLNFPTITSVPVFQTFFQSLLSTNIQTDSLKFLLDYLSEITFPVYTYTFFIALCEYCQFSLQGIEDILSAYITENSIHMKCPNKFSQDPLKTERQNADILGNALLHTFVSYLPSSFPMPPFDNSFMININPMNETAQSLQFKQSSSGLAYYENILC